MTSGGPAWGIANLVEALNSWAVREDPPDRVRAVVRRWAFEQHENPYRGVVLVPGFPNLYFGEVPGTRSGDTALSCMYWVEVAARRVRWDNFTRLHLPFDYDPDPLVDPEEQDG